MAESLIIEHDGKKFALSTEDLEQFELTEESAAQVAAPEEEDVSGYLIRTFPRVYVGPDTGDLGYVWPTPTRAPRR